MALCHINYFVPSVGQMMTMEVIVPQGRPGPFPVLYLLHGLSDDSTAWTRRTSIERYVDGLGLMVVMPQTHRAFYTNAAYAENYRYEDHIVKDVIGFIDATFPTKATRAGRVIGGLSMGGYGGMKLALKHPKLFVAGHSHSGAVRGAFRKAQEEPKRGLDQREFDAIFGDQQWDSPNDPMFLATHCPEKQRPALYIDCGKDDFLLEANRSFHKHLLKLKYKHVYKEFPGNHNWGYWDEHIQDALAFYKPLLKL